MKVVKKFVVDGLPANRVIEFFGRIDSHIFFVVHRPEGNSDLFGYKVSIGSMDKLEDIKINSIFQPRSGELVIKTVQGEFIFGNNRRYLQATFGGQPIELF